MTKKSKKKFKNATVTTVKVETEKWELIKSYDYDLQEIVDNAFNNILKIENMDLTQLQKQKLKLQKKIEYEESNLTDSLNSFKEKKEKILKELEEEEKEIKQDITNRINNLNHEIRLIDDKLEYEEEKYQQEQYKHERLKDYNVLIDKFEVYNCNWKNKDFQSLIIKFAEKYNEDHNEIMERVIEDSNNRL